MNAYGAYTVVVPVSMIVVTRTTSFWLRVMPRLRRFGWRPIERSYSCSGVVFSTRLITTIVGHSEYFASRLTALRSIVGAQVHAFKLARRPPAHLLARRARGVLFPALAQMDKGRACQFSVAAKASWIFALIVMSRTRHRT